jgi:peptide/nickel transport system substrate-binding protein
VSRRGGRPGRRWRGIVSTTAVLALVSTTVAACGTSGAGTTNVTYVAVPDRNISFGTTEAPSGCNPNTPGGDTPGTLTVLGAVLPSPYVVNEAGSPTANNNLIVQSELINTSKPETVVYTLDPKAVWSDGVPITAADFRYAWEQQRQDTSPGGQDVASIAGYRDISSVTGSNQGHTVTVRFKKTFADWRSLFTDLMPAHIMEKVGWNPSCTTVDPTIDLSGGPFKIGSVSPQSITLVQNPKWWGTPANARQITVRIASSTDQLAHWMSSGVVQVAQPATVTPSFLSSMTSLPGASSEVDLSGAQLQLDMASSLDSNLSPDLRAAIALSVNRQKLVNSEVSWAFPGIAVANSHVYVQGQPGYTPTPGSSTTTTIPAPSPSSTTTTHIGAGGTVNFPVTSVPDQAAAFVSATGLVRGGSDSMYHSAFGVPFTLRLVYDAADPWAASAAPAIRDDLVDAGFTTTLTAESDATETGEALAGGTADLAVMPTDFTPYLSQTMGWYTMLLGPPGRNGSEDWTGYDDPAFDRTVTAASQQLNTNTAASAYQQADTDLWDEMVSLPLYAEPTALVWSRRIGGITPTPRSDSLLWYAQMWAVRVPESTNNTTPSLPGQ